MLTFNFNDPPPKVTFSDFKDPEPKRPRVPVYVGLHQLLKEKMGATTSIGGQTFAYVPRQHNSFNVPLRSDFIKNWLTERWTAIGNPAPSNNQLSEAIRAFESRSAAGPSSGMPLQMYVRTAWCPFYREPVPETDERGYITGYNRRNSCNEEAIVFSLSNRSPPGAQSPITTQILGRYLKEIKSFQVTSKKNNGIVTVTLCDRL